MAVQPDARGAEEPESFHILRRHLNEPHVRRDSLVGRDTLNPHTRCLNVRASLEVEKFKSGRGQEPRS